MRPTSIQAADFCRMAKAQHGGRFSQKGGEDRRNRPSDFSLGWRRYENCIRTNARTHALANRRCKSGHAVPTLQFHSRLPFLWLIQGDHSDPLQTQISPETKHTPPPPAAAHVTLDCPCGDDKQLAHMWPTPCVWLTVKSLYFSPVATTGGIHYLNVHFSSCGFVPSTSSPSASLIIIRSSRANGPSKNLNGFYSTHIIFTKGSHVKSLKKNKNTLIKDALQAWWGCFQFPTNDQ